MKCQPCGQDNAASALFCTACRRPLVAPAKLPPRLEPLAQPAMAAAGSATIAPQGSGAASRNRFSPPRAGRASGMADDADLLTEGEAWAALIGGSATEHYLHSFERLANGESGGWNWSAFFLRVYWLLYRKMWMAALLWFFAPLLSLMVVAALAAVVPKAVPLLLIVWLVGLLVLPGLKGNAWYYRHCEKILREVRARGGSKEQTLARLEAAGGTSNVLLVILALFGVVSGVGILAAVAMPAYQSYTIKAKVSETIPVGADVAAAVGQQYERTGQLPSQSDVDGFLRQASHRSRFVRAVDLDATSGTVTLRIDVGARDGSIQFVPSSDNNRHFSWTCTTPDLQRYVPASCRPEGAPTR